MKYVVCTQQLHTTAVLDLCSPVRVLGRGITLLQLMSLLLCSSLTCFYIHFEVHNTLTPHLHTLTLTSLTCVYHAHTYLPMHSATSLLSHALE